MEPVILVHGGAGDIADSSKPEKIAGVKKAVEKGNFILAAGGSAIDAVEAAVHYMETDEAFNAGYGSVLNLDGEVEMDASIMVGADLSAGAVTVVKDIEHPISLARLIMEKTPHVLFAAEGAQKIAKAHGMSILPEGYLVTKRAEAALERHIHSQGLTEIAPVSEGSTVGAVAIDAQGRLAAATSTGGMSGKMVGRSSDTSMIGSGTYADDNVGAVSTTGHGETILKYCLAHSIVKLMEGGMSAVEGTNTAIKRMTERLNNTAGAITLSKTGEIGVAFSSKRMSWAYQRGKELHYGIEHDEDVVETL